jgi:hypothetical protein
MSPTSKLCAVVVLIVAPLTVEIVNEIPVVSVPSKPIRV